MELLKKPEVKNMYDKCKYKVKLWEHEFKKKNGRIPSKLDIREANTEVRLAYRKYFQLKTAALEVSLMDADGFLFDSESDTTQKESQESLLVENSLSFSDDSFNIDDSDMTQNDNNCDQVNTDSCLPNPNVNRTWGVHLNKKSKPQKSNKPEGKTSMNSSYSKKLFQGSKFSKRNPRKSLSFVSKKKNIPTPIDTNLQLNNLKNLKTNDLKIIPGATHIQSQPLNMQSFLSNNYKARQTLDVGWMKRVANTTGITLSTENITKTDAEVSRSVAELSTTDCTSDATKIDYESEDIITDSEEEENSRNILHIAKKQRTSINEFICNSNLDHSLVAYSTNAEKTSVPLNFANIFKKTETNTNSNGEINKIKEVGNNLNSLNPLNSTKDQCYNFIPEDENDSSLESKSTRKTKKSYRKTLKSQCKTSEAKIDKQENVFVRKSTRAHKTRVNLSEYPESENEDPFHSDGDSRDSEFTLEKRGEQMNSFADLCSEGSGESRTKVHSSKKKLPTAKAKKLSLTAKKKKSSPTTEAKQNTTEKETYELEYSIKPRIITAPRQKISSIIKCASKSLKKSSAMPASDKDQSGLVKDKAQQAKEKLHKKIESGNLNENYVQLNMKKKIYVRGKSNINFAKHKKQMWKNKKKQLYGPNMDMGGCDGGVLNCFKCGQPGHFARYCKSTRGDSLLPAEADEEVCPFPTLKEAAKMAETSVLAIRKGKYSYTDKSQTLESNPDLQSNDLETSTLVAPESEKEPETEPDNDEIDLEDMELLLETERIEEEIAKLDMFNYLDSTTHIKPYYDLNEDGSLLETPEELFKALRLFGHSSFRSGQELAVMRILSGKSTLVTLSTGSGKSLCYQLPAYMYSQRQRCISLIISPLVSLMEDQLTGIPSFLKATCLHTNQTKIQRAKIMDSISSGDVDILLVSPEAVVAGERSTGFGSFLRKLPPIAFACIDEAHCVSQWSHNFRPSYLMICRVLRDRLGVKTILGLTATATRATSDSIIRHLQIPDGIDGIISDIPLPDNLYLTVSRDAQKDHALFALLMTKRFVDCKSIIIYCTRREECERVATFLRTGLKSYKLAPAENNKKRKRPDVQAEPYHAGLSASRRRNIQKTFMAGELRIVVATVAFGMGINKSDIRAVIHYNMPKNFESYVQEVGRAGRDGLPAHCHLFLDSRGGDENELRRHIFGNSIDRHAIRKLLQKVFLPCSCKTKCTRHEVAFSVQETIQALDVPEENIETLLCYLELHGNCNIELLSQANIACKVISYGGPNEIRKAAKDCPPLAMGMLMYKKSNKDANVVEFPIIDVASTIGWDSGICKHKLKNLEWTSVNNQPKRSKLTVLFSNIGFRLLAPGNLSESELDEALDNLHQRVVDQERTALQQLHAVHATLISVALPSVKTCISEEEYNKNQDLLKSKIREYFASPKPLDMISSPPRLPLDENRIINDVRSLVTMYKDNVFTGRAVARIFHGIQSPNYPAVIWGRCKFWRSHLGSDFNAICTIATREILKLR